MASGLHTPRRMRFAFMVLLVLSGCESGVARVVEVTVPDEVSSRFSASQRGLLVTDVGGAATPFVVLCGQALPKPLQLSQDLGFGCVGARNGTSETVRAWVQPLDAGVGDDAGVSCSASREFYEQLALTQADGGTIVAPEPESGFAQGSGTGTWRRDVSPCGGVMSVKVTVQ